MKKEVTVQSMGRLTLSEVSLRPSGWFTRLVWGRLNLKVHVILSSGGGAAL